MERRTAGHKDLAALLQMLGANLSQLAKRRNLDPERFGIFFASGIFPLAVGSNLKTRHGLSIWQIAQFWILTQITDDLQIDHVSSENVFRPTAGESAAVSCPPCLG